MEKCTVQLFALFITTLIISFFVYEIKKLCVFNFQMLT